LPTDNDLIELKYETICVDQIKVGDIIELKEGEGIPADCILLNSNNPNGEAFIMTAALDGERNLKLKSAPKFIQANHANILADRSKFKIKSESTVN